MSDLKTYVKGTFGVEVAVLLDALRESPSSRGYIIGAVSEFLLKGLLERKGYEVQRIVEKPSGGFDAKSAEARGDFYIRKKGVQEDKWFVVESKGLKSNAEFFRSQLDSKDKVFKWLKKRVFRPADYNGKKFIGGMKRYNKAKQTWEAANPGKEFPPFAWNREHPGSESYCLEGLWQDESDLLRWVERFSDEAFTEKAYRAGQGPIALLDTHAPSQRVSAVTKKKQAGPLVCDFSIMAVDLFIRTAKHEFVFMNPEKISHSPGSPEHLYQNYTIDILVRGKKEEAHVSPPWYADIDACIEETAPRPRKLDLSQVDTRQQE